MSKWIAWYAPADSNCETKRGFNSEEEAWKYVATQLCKQCLKEYETGISYDLDENEEPYSVEHPSETSCGAEWFVLTEEAYDKAEGFDGILEASGWKKVQGKEEVSGYEIDG